MRRDSIICVGLLAMVSVAIYAVLNTYYSADYSNLYWVIPAFFFVFFAVELALPMAKSGAKLMNLFLITKVVKILLSIGLLLFYVKGMDGSKMFFPVVFLVFYFASLAIETFYFSRLMKRKNG